MFEYRQNVISFKRSQVYQKPLSVGQAAKVCNVSKKSVLNWIYKDALKAFTTCGGHHRIWPAELNKLLEKSGMEIPFNYVDERRPKFLILDDDADRTTRLKKAVYAEFPSAEIFCTENGYEALLLIGERKPSVVFIDLHISTADGSKILDLLKKGKKYEEMEIIVLPNSLDHIVRGRLDWAMADKVPGKLFDFKETIRSLTKN